MSKLEKIVLVEQNPDWGGEFARAAADIRGALGQVLVEIHHIGSTAISGISAKPIIDILVGVSSVEELDDLSTSMNVTGYEAMGEFGIPGRRFFTKHNEAGDRKQHVHAFIVGSEEITKHINFRDFLRAHPQHAQQYEALKQMLVSKYSMDRDKYTEGKSDFINEMNAKAALWRLSAD